MRFDGRRALITGGGRGIGRETAVALAREGADVAIGYLRDDRSAAQTAALVEEHGRRAVLVRGHLGDPAHVERVVAEAAAGLGGLDLLVSNAASGVLRPALELEPRHWDWTLSVNARALLVLAREAVPWMREAGRGAIVAVSSIGSFRTLAGYAAVGSSKAAIEALVRYLAVELAGEGIRVNAVSGGVVDTDALRHFPEREAMLEAARRTTPAGRLLEPHDLAAAILFLLSDDAAMVVGQTLLVDGGYTLPA